MINFDEEKKKKLNKILSSVTYCTLSTCMNGDPHTTIVQPSVTTDLKIIILSKKNRKKIKNLNQNNQAWLTFDATGAFKVPKAIYIKGVATMEVLNQKTFEEFLSYHGFITKKIYKNLTSEGFDNSVRIQIEPERIITIGIFGKSQEPVSFQLNLDK